MTSLVIPKTPVTNKKREGNHRHYTLHIGTTIFTVQHQDTSVLSFRKKSDAVSFGRILECHYDLTKEWPILKFDDYTVYGIFEKNPRLKYLDIKDWDNESLRYFCITNAFSMIDVLKFENERKLYGKTFRWDAPSNLYIDMLNKRLVN